MRKPKTGYKFVKGLFGKYEEIPEEWGFVILNSIIERKNNLIDPFNFPDEEFELYSIPSYHKYRSPEIIFGKDIHSNKIFVDNNTALFGKINPDLPKIWFVLSSTKLRKISFTEFIPLKGNFKADSKFLYYLSWSKFLYGKCKSFVSGTTPSRERVEPKAFLKIFVPLPSLSEQEKIASILSGVDALIESTQNVIVKTEKLKKGLMQKLLIRGIGHTKFKKVAWLFGKEIEIPEEWQKTTVGNHTSILVGNAFPSKKYSKNPKDMKLLRGDNITEGTIRWKEKTRYWSKSSKFKKYQLSEQDFVISMDGSKVGKNYAYIKKQDLPCLLVQRVSCLRAHSTLTQKYFGHIFGNKNFINYVNSVRTNSGIPHISTNDIQNFQLLLPPLPEQQKIASILSGVDAKNYYQSYTNLRITLTIFLMFLQMNTYVCNYEFHNTEKI